MFTDGNQNRHLYSQDSNNLSFLHLSGNPYADNPSGESLDDDSLCPFCPKLLNLKEAQIMLNNALYQKYSSSQNYYYKKEIEKFYCEKVDLVASTRKKICEFNDLAAFNENNEYLLQYFWKDDLKEKLGALVEYYKFHNEVPRLFFKKLMRTIYKFYNKKRKLQFQKLQKLLNDGSKHSGSNYHSKISQDYSLILKSKYFCQSKTQSINLKCLEIELSKIQMQKITESQLQKQSYSSFFNQTLFSILHEEDNFFTPKDTPKMPRKLSINQQIKFTPGQKLRSDTESTTNQQLPKKRSPFQNNIEKINTELNQIFPKNKAFINIF